MNFFIPKGMLDRVSAQIKPQVGMNNPQIGVKPQPINQQPGMVMPPQSPNLGNVPMGLPNRFVQNPMFSPYMNDGSYRMNPFMGQSISPNMGHPNMGPIMRPSERYFNMFRNPLFMMRQF